MAIGFNFNWHGDRVIDEVAERINRQLDATGRSVVQIAETYAPKRTGRLATSIAYHVDYASHTLTISVGAPYGVFVEYGTRHMRPQPYLRPALNTVGSIWGIDVEMAFNNTPMVHAPIMAAGAGFHLPSTLTTKQLGHVRRHLLPTSKRHHIANVSRAKLRVRHR